MIKYSISAVILAYNEQNNITPLIKKTDRVLKQKFFDYEIIVVNDGSQDNTLSVLKELTLKYPKLKIVTHTQNKGYGAAVVSGLKTSQYELVFFTDGDNQFNVEEINKLLPYIDDSDLVAGYRVKRSDNFFKRINTLAWNILIRFLFKVKVKDLDCAFKLFRKTILEKIDLRRVKSQGAMINAEILVRLKKVDAKIVEVPVSHFHRKFGKQTGASLKVIAKAFKELAMFYRELHN
ncbi:MAG: glycosyltransferase family 2 protein [Candidatus Kaelpia imicola]|nr:glycosyltransferase family 2 protein [Candidatus Kaelpia imicola]